METLSPRFLGEVREHFTSSFYFACVAVLESQFPDSRLTIKVHKELCDVISDHKNNHNVAVVLPRDWLKSTVCSIYYPVWRAMLDENFTSMLVFNTFRNAGKKLLAIRTLIRTNPLLRQLYPERMPDLNCQQNTEGICLPRKVPMPDMTFEAAGVGTDVTSRHFKLVIEDDPVAPEFDNMTGEIYEPSKDQVEKALGFHRSIDYLLDDIKNDQRIFVGTRWLERDPLAWIEAHEPHYRFVRRAARQNANGDPDENGEIIYPERFDEEVLDRLRATSGEYMYQALMMNSPMASKDMLFKVEDIQFYDTTPQGLLNFTTVDPAPPDSSGQDPDYNVVLTCGVGQTDGQVYVLDYFHSRCSPGELINAIFSHVERFSPVVVGIEAIGYQKSIEWWIKELQNRRKLWFNVEPCPASHRAKDQRITGLQPMIQAKKLFLRDHMNELRQELVSYPRGAHDDLIDALAYQPYFWRQSTGYIPEKLDVGPEKFTGAAVLQELRERNRPKNCFPFDTGVDQQKLMRSLGLIFVPPKDTPWKREYARQRFN